MSLSLHHLLNPSEIKSYSKEQLDSLALSIRERIIEVMSKNGGHLASNLGMVETTIALHKVFNSPSDKFIFDTSHQAYTHKLLTGRDKDFDTIRQYLGLSGFTSPQESQHDHFFAGHAGTSLSLSLGALKSRDLHKENHYIIPILGDAAFTCGLTHEALNNISKEMKKFILILNDNAMSISKNVGAITGIFSEESKTLEKLVSHLKEKLGLPSSLEESDSCNLFKTITNAASFFKLWGFNYFGPVDGHDISSLVEALENVKEIDGPVVLHVKTIKGYGLDMAAKDPVCYHGARPFEKETGEFLSPSPINTFPKIFGKHLLNLSLEHSNLITLTPAMPVGSCLVDVMKQFPDRCLDVGIAEGHCVTYAGGLALNRANIVIVSIYATFLQRALDNLFHDVCLQKAPVIFAIDRAGLAGGDGATHNGIYDLGFLKSMPNLIIAQPRNGKVLKELLTSALSYLAPVAIRYPNLPTEENINEPFFFREIGESETLQIGSKILILSLGHKCQTAFEVSKILEERGFFPTIIDPVFVKPLDKKLIEMIESHQYVVTIEEHALASGFGEAINSFVMLHQIKACPILNIGLKDIYVDHGSHKELTKQQHLDASSIANNILNFFGI
jgi:1-deoxy-D-xylulose-5-phosphate synthase